MEMGLEKRCLHDKGFINGAWVNAKSGKTFSVTNPANDQVIANVPDMNGDDAEASIEAAQNAFLSWRHTTGKVFYSFYNLDSLYIYVKYAYFNRM